MEKFADDKILENDKSTFWHFKGKYDFVDNWFLMGSPYPILAITAMYLLFVLKIGPDYMKSRRPFQLKHTLLLYNAFQVFVSAYMVNECIKVIHEVGVLHSSCLTDTNEDKHRLGTLMYYYFACKISELLDTVLFVLRKKQNQVTFLHVYHHALMAFNGWVFLKYEPGYWLLFLGTMNSFVHTVMYTYYGLSVYPSLQKYLWWKKYITSLQLLQFGLILIHMTVNYFVNECRVSIYTVLYAYFNLMLFIYLFSSFYKKAYVKNKEVKNGTNGKMVLNNNLIQEKGVTYRNVGAKKIIK